MTDMQFAALVLILAAATAATRALPFVIFRETDRQPVFVEYLGRVLPAAMMGLLVVYCYKDVSISESIQLISTAVASAAVVAVHLLRHNTILSIVAGTAVYTLLLRM